MMSIVNDANSLIDVVNSVIEDLGKQGIHMSKLDRLEVKEDLMSLTSKLKLGRQRLNTIVEFFKELEKYETP